MMAKKTADETRKPKPAHRFCPKCNAEVHNAKSACECGYEFPKKTKEGDKLPADERLALALVKQCGGAKQAVAVIQRLERIAEAFSSPAQE